MARERFETIGNCCFCKKQSKIIFTKKGFFRSMVRFLCEDCTLEFRKFNDSINRRVPE